MSETEIKTEAEDLMRTLAVVKDEIVRLKGEISQRNIGFSGYIARLTSSDAVDIFTSQSKRLEALEVEYVSLGGKLEDL